MSTQPADRRPVAVITAGGTREPIDDVRHVTNVASGRLPAGLANALLMHGWHVHYVHGPGAVLPGAVHAAFGFVDTTTAALQAEITAAAERARELQRVCEGRLSLHPITTAADVAAALPRTVAQVKPELVICAMAVADYAPVPAVGKLASTQAAMLVRMTPTAKTIDLVRSACSSTTVVGFKLLSGANRADQRAACLRLARRAEADYVFCNDVLDYHRGVRRGRLFDSHGGVVAEIDGGPDVELLAKRLAEQLLVVPRHT